MHNSQKIILFSKWFPAFVLGGIMVVIAYAATAMGGVLQAGLSIQGAINGPLMGTFLLGMMVPQCTKVGAFAGTLSGIVSVLGSFRLLY